MNFWIFTLMLLSTEGFFNYHGMFSMVAIRSIFYLLTAVAFVLALTERGSSLRNIDYPRYSYWGLIILISTSLLVATILYHQDLIVSIVATIPYVLGYLWFYILMRLRIPASKMMRLFAILAILGSITYFINVVTFPNNMFGAPLLEDLSRGIQRIPIQFSGFLPLFVYYGIFKYKNSKQKKYIIIIGACAIMVLLSVVRQTILLTAVLGLWYLMKGTTLTKKITICGLSLAFIIIVIPKIPFYNDIMELTEKQLDGNKESEEDIRIQAWRYYSYESWDNGIFPLFGHGIPSIGKSTYGNTFESNADATKCFAEDVGWAGFSYYFGIPASVLLFLLFFQAIKKAKSTNKPYLSYWFVQILITSVAGGAILYFMSIAIISTMLYMAYAPDDEVPDEVSTEPDINGKDSSSAASLSIRHQP